MKTARRRARRGDAPSAPHPALVEAANSLWKEARLGEIDQADAHEALAAMGLSVSDAVRILLKRVVADQAFPLELRVPNTKTRAAMTEAEEIARTRRGRFATPDELFVDLEEINRQ